MKPRTGFFDFTGCEGCQLAVLGLEDELLELAALVEIAEFREVMTGGGQPLDIAFVEGSVAGPEEEARLREIRARTRTLVALGACADTGGVNALTGFQSLEALDALVYGTGAHRRAGGYPLPLSAVVAVDHRIPGCPIDEAEFLEVLQALVVGRTPELPSHPVCVECKLAELACAFEQGRVCMGPVTRAGCRARCVEGGDRCRGCRGLVDNPRSEPYYRLLQDRGLTQEDVLVELRLFNRAGGGAR